MLDASAVIAWLRRERGAETVAKTLPYAVVPASALTETLYGARERGHRLEMTAIIASLTGMGTEIEPVVQADSLRAAELIEASRRARTSRSDPRLSLGDGLCLAVAERLGLPVTGGDELWETVELTVAYRPFR